MDRALVCCTGGETGRWSDLRWTHGGGDRFFTPLRVSTGDRERFMSINWGYTWPVGEFAGTGSVNKEQLCIL